MALPGLIDGLEIYQAYLLVLLFCFVFITFKFFQDYELRVLVKVSKIWVYHYKTTGSCLSLVKTFWKAKNCCVMVIPYPSWHFNIQLIEMSGDICKLIFKRQISSEHTNSGTIY